MSASKDAKEIKDSLEAQDSKLSKLEAMIQGIAAFVTGKPKASKAKDEDEEPEKVEDEEDPEKDEPENAEGDEEEDEESDAPESDEDEAEDEDEDEDKPKDVGARLDRLTKSVTQLTKNFDEAVSKAVDAKTKTLEADNAKKVKKEAAKSLSKVTGKPLASANDNPLAGKPGKSVDDMTPHEKMKDAMAKRRSL